MVQLKIVLDARKPKKDGSYPIYYRITQKKKTSYLYSGFSILLSQWDESRTQVKKSNPNAQFINTSLSKRYFELQKHIIELNDNGIFSLDALKDSLTRQEPIRTVKEFTEALIEEMFEQNHVGNATVYQTALNSLFKFKPSKGLTFSDITPDLLERYKRWLAETGCGVNTISNYLRTIRAIYNKAIRRGAIDRKYYPFTEITIKTERTAKRAFSKEIIAAIERLDVNPVEGRARDYYMLSFYLIGINFTDIAYLQRSNICDGRVEYRRRKTKHQYSIKILPKTQALIDKYSTDNKYLFSILPDDIVEDSLRAKRLIQQWIKTTNKYLKRISEMLKLDKPCTTYTVRHSWATIAKRLGYSKELIGEALGHQQGNQVTEIYLDAFDKEVVDDMNGKICTFIHQPY